MVRIMLDPGHAGNYYNASPVLDGYYESNMTWSLAGKLKSALEARGFAVGLTRAAKDDDPELTERGRRSAGYDLFLSLHSNAAGSESPDSPWMIHMVSDGKTDIDERSRAVAHLLGPVISKTMSVSDATYHTKGTDFDRDGNGYIDDEWYGVLFGAKSVGVPGVILEHSFHTNRKAAEWLSSDVNLSRLAEAEADALAAYYGMEVNSPMTDAEKREFRALSDKVADMEKTLERHNDQIGVKWAYIDRNLPDWAAPTVKKLASRGYLKGNGENSFELSRLMLRVLVMIDRAGAFDK